MNPIRTRWLRIAPAVVLAAALGCGPAGATSLKDIEIGIRGINFLNDPPRGRIEVAVIQDGQNRASVQDAQAISGWIAANRNPKVELVPVAVDVRDLDAARYKVAIVALGQEAHFPRILDFARRNGALTITADLACVRSGSCVMGINSEPNVEVIVSRQASAASGIGFVRAFHMMVKEY
ncbi:MAG: hypothetical protein ACM31L_01480 [Actinomycetota bacterium]